MLRRVFAAAVVFVLPSITSILFAMPAYALSDVGGSRDHPLFRRPPGYKIVSYSSGHRSATLPFRGDAVALSGKQSDLLYRTEGKPVSPSDLTQRFLAALNKAGAEIVYMENTGLGGRRIAGRLLRPGRTVWVMQDVLSLREYRLVILESPNNRRPLPSAPVSRDIYEMEAQVLDLLHRVESTGKLEFPVKFASGSDTPLKGYESDFRKLVMLMRKDPSLNFRVETWADDGTKPAERRMQLRKRAAALTGILADMGADGNRLSPSAGDAADADVPRGIVRLTAVESIENQKR